MRRPILIGAFGLLGLAAAGGFFLVGTALEPLEPATSGEPPPPVRIIEIPDGTTLRQLAVTLEQERLIRSRMGFLLLGKVAWADRRVQAGEYALHAGMRPADMLSDVLNGRVVLHAVTIPEGFNLAQIADALAGMGLANTKEFLRLTHDRDFLHSLDVEADSLEGYLFPNTYRIAKHTKVKDIITAMVEGMREVWTAELQQRARDVDMTVHQVLTLASVIEKETSVGAERPLISAVFHNRLRRRIPLQSDPTVIYGIPDFDGNLRKRDLSISSPYNTYRHRGLPPGPIASPGAASIRAALYPAPTNFLYFVSRNDGTHEFSSTLAQHNKAVDKYQRRRHKQQPSRGPRDAQKPSGTA